MTHTMVLAAALLALDALVLFAAFVVSRELRRSKQFAAATLELFKTIGEWSDRGLLNAVPDAEQDAAINRFANALGVDPASIQATGAAK